MGRLAALLALAAVCACQQHAPKADPVCPRARAAFELEVSTDSATLPESLVVRVGFGGAESEAYSPKLGNRHNTVLCCSSNANASLRPMTCGQDLSAEDAGEASNPVPTMSEPKDASDVRCQVWSNGAAELTVSARGFAPVHRTLAAEPDSELPQCSVWHTVAVPLILRHGDAGVIESP